MTAEPLRLCEDDPLGQAVGEALREADVEAVQALIAERPELATARLVATDPSRAGERTLLHVFADWPGRRVRVREMVELLTRAGADVNAPFVGAHAETPLHWAASNDDVELIDALLDAGADLEAPGSVIAGGTPVADATAFGGWQAADRLIARGAQTNLYQAATMGLNDRVSRELAASPPPDAEQLTAALWGACAGGRQATASQLLSRGADPNWVGWGGKTAVDAAQNGGANRLAMWLRKRGGHSAVEL